MAVTIEKTKVSEFFTEVNSQIKGIKGVLDSFNGEVSLLGNGTTWVGSAAVTNVEELSKIYISYLNLYDEFVTVFKNNVNNIFTNLSEVVQACGGSALVIDGIQVVDFSKPTVSDLTFDGEKMPDPTTVENITKNLKSYQEDIKSKFNLLSSKMDEIGNGSAFFDTSSRVGNEAQALKTSIQDFVTDLQTRYPSNLDVCISNIDASRMNFING